MMELGGLQSLERLLPEGVRRSHWLRPRYPLVAVELREDAVIATRLAHRRGHYHLGGHGRKRLSEGVFLASASGVSCTAPDELASAIIDALRLAGAEKASRISVAIPDTAARAFLIDLQEIPPSAEQASEVIRWRLRKSLPFSLDDARLAWQELGRAEDGRVQLLVTVVPSEGLEVLEDLFVEMGLRVGLIDLATFGAFNALRLEGVLVPDESGDVALLTATSSYFSLMILRGERVIFYRAKNYHVRGGFQGDASLRVVGRELLSSLGYYEEHLLGEGLSRMHLRVVGIESALIARVAEEVGCEVVVPVKLERTIAELQGVGEDELSELLPTVGLALRREP